MDNLDFHGCTEECNCDKKLYFYPQVGYDYTLLPSESETMDRLTKLIYDKDSLPGDEIDYCEADTYAVCLKSDLSCVNFFHNAKGEVYLPSVMFTGDNPNPVESDEELLNFYNLLKIQTAYTDNDLMPLNDFTKVIKNSSFQILIDNEDALREYCIPTIHNQMYDVRRHLEGNLVTVSALKHTRPEMFQLLGRGIYEEKHKKIVMKSYTFHSIISDDYEWVGDEKVHIDGYIPLSSVKRKGMRSNFLYKKLNEMSPISGLKLPFFLSVNGYDERNVYVHPEVLLALVS